MRLDDTTCRSLRLAALCGAALVAGACSGSGDSPTRPRTPADTLQLTSAQVGALDSAGQEIVRANPGNVDLEAFADSTLAVFTAGIRAVRVDVSTDLTTHPLYLVGIHRAATTMQGSFSTWTLVALDSPDTLGNVIEVSGFAQSGGSTPPASVSGTIGDGSGIVNALLLQVGSGGQVSEWYANAGTVSFSSDAPGAPCPNFTPTPTVTCALETMHVKFDATAPSATAGTRHASVATVVSVPAMRLTYTP